jgi:regulator of protease activity HflC (stomatin/prohibitin superfamily)
MTAIVRRSPDFPRYSPLSLAARRAATFERDIFRAKSPLDAARGCALEGQSLASRARIFHRFLFIHRFEASMFKTFSVKLNERVVLFKDGLPRRAYGPGRYVAFGRRLTEQRWNTDQLVFRALPEVRATLAAEWYEEVTLGALERGVLYRDGAPVVFLRPGVHRYWKVDPSVRLVVFDVNEPLPSLTVELEALIPKGEYIDVIVQAHEKGLRFEQGRLLAVLDPGRYKLWTHPEARAQIQNVDMRQAELTIAGQDLLTRDKVTLRLTLTAEYAVTDPVLALQKAANARDSLYLAVQLAARDYVAGVTLDELLEGRDALTRYLEHLVLPKAAELGLRVERVGVKDVVLPGEMKTLLNRVIEAEKEAAANVILRREETAATRSLVNTARLMADQPVLLRLKELEAMKEIASQIKEVRIVVGSENLKGLLPAELLGKAQLS